MKVCHKCGTPTEASNRFCMECGAELGETSDPLVGKTIGGNFVVREVLGIGGMGRVYRGEQNILGRSVAIKVIHPHLLSDDQTVQRFYTEARAASRLNHPNSVSVIDFGRSDDGVLYLVMEYLDGSDLSKVAAEQGPLAIERVVEMTSQVLDALEEAHALGIVHRDLKPENVVVLRSRAGQERVKVLDFGLATVVGIGSGVTRPGLVCGTPAYMSPEQAKGDTVDARSDLYSVGAMLYELLTEHPPFEADSPVKLLLKHVHDPVPDPAADAPQRGISSGLAAVVMKALAKDPAQRFATAVEFKKALTQAKGTSSSSAERPRLCVSCGATNERMQRYCGSCGARLPGFSTGPARTRRSLTPSKAIATVALVGRDAHLERYEALHELARSRSVVVRVDGEAGSGRTRLLEEFVSRASSVGDLAVYVGRHPIGIPVAYHHVRQLARELLALPAGTGFIEGTSSLKVGPLVKAGFAELDAPTGLRGVDGAPRTGAVAAALVFSIRQGRMRSGAARVVLAIDDLDKANKLSADAVRMAVEECAEDPVLVITVGAIEGVAAEVIATAPLEYSAAAACLGETDPGDAVDFRILPSVLAQLQATGETLAEFRTRSGRSAADVASGRLDRLGLTHRKLLQALAALGRKARVEHVREVSQLPDLEVIGELVTRGLLFVEGEEVGFVDPFIRELVSMGTPAEARRTLHSAALDVAIESGAPQDVVAEHAALANDGMRSLLFLERAGDVALRRGDVHGAIRIYRRGSDIARNDALLSGEMMFDAARVSFSRKLGDAMMLAGEYVMADGLLREVLDLPEIDRIARARIHLAVARVARERARLDEAARQLNLALQFIGSTHGELEALIHLELGELRVAQGSWPTAIEAFTKTIEVASAGETDRTLIARAYARLADAAVATSQRGPLEAALEKLDVEAKRAEVPAVAARCYLRCSQASFATNREDLLHRALELAAEAGDAESFRAAAAGLEDEAA